MEIGIKDIQKIEFIMLSEIVDIFDEFGIEYFLAFGSLLGAIRHGGAIPWDSDMDLFVVNDDLKKAEDALRKNLSPLFRVVSYLHDGKEAKIFPRVALANTSSYQLHIDLFPLIGLPNDRKKAKKICFKTGIYGRLFNQYKQFCSGIRHRTKLKMFIGRSIEVFFSFIPYNFLYSNFYKYADEFSFKDSQLVICATTGKLDHSFNKEVFEPQSTCLYENKQVYVPNNPSIFLQRYYGNYNEIPPASERENGMQFSIHIDDRDYETLKVIMDFSD